MHRPGVTGDQQVGPCEQCRYRQKVVGGRRVDERTPWQPSRDLVDKRTIGRRTREEDRGAARERELARHLREAFRRPLLDGSPAADVQRNQRTRSRPDDGLGALPMFLRDRQKRGRPALRDAAEHSRYQSSGIVRRVRTRVVLECVVQKRTSARAPIASRPGRTGRGEHQVAADIRFEIDGQVIVPLPPPSRGPHKRGNLETLTASREPRGVEGLNAIDERDGAGQFLVPAADDQVNSRLWCKRADGGHPGQRHEEVANAFQSQEEDTRGAARWPPSPEGPREGGACREQHIAGCDERALARIVDLQA